ncbi:MAG TPA: HEAT repeat domain-containing protein, partial [Polyangiaceae bacterium]
MSIRETSGFGALVFSILLSQCHGKSRDGRESKEEPRLGSSVATAAPGEDAPLSRARELIAVEQRRDSAKIVDSDFSSRNVIVRRRAARALARIADARSWDLLRRLLSDEDETTVAWSAYGLGYTCQGHELETVKLLVARAASLTGVPGRSSAEPHPAALESVEPMFAIADALGRCGGSQAERTLVACLSRPSDRAEDAALALGRLAFKQGRLSDSSVGALLDAASRPAPVQNALYPFGWTGSLSRAAQARLLSVATEALKTAGEQRAYAVRALGRTGSKAAAVLGRVMTEAGFSAAERADAIRALSHLKGDGDAQQALRALLDKLAPSLLSDPSRMSQDFGLLSALLEALEPPVSGARATLT